MRHARAHGGGYCHSDEGNGKHESSAAGWPSRGTAKTRSSTRPYHSAGAPPAYHPHLERGESPTAVERRGNTVLHEKGDKMETTAAPRSCHARVRFSLKWLPGDSAFTVRRRDSYRRSRAGFDRMARLRT